jgi:hypothetical protein
MHNTSKPSTSPRISQISLSSCSEGSNALCESALSADRDHSIRAMGIWNGSSEHASAFIQGTPTLESGSSPSQSSSCFMCRRWYASALLSRPRASFTHLMGSVMATTGWVEGVADALGA